MNREATIEKLGVACGIFLCLFFFFGAAVFIIASVLGGQLTLHIPTWSAVKPRLANAGIWAGTCGGVLTIIDWLTPVSKKNRIKDITVSVWIWLAGQRAGRFTRILLGTKAQRAFALITHLSIAFVIVAFLGKSYRFSKQANIELGHPRLYPFQIWVDVFAIALSSWLFGWRLYPRIMGWAASSGTVGKFFKRALGVYACCWLLLWLVVALQAPIFLTMFANADFEDRAVESHAIELALHGKAVVVLLHAVTAVISAPVLAALLMFQIVVFLSFYWLLMVMSLILVFRAIQYLIEQLAAGNQGPVLALSALLVAVSAALKILL